MAERKPIADTIRAIALISTTLFVIALVLEMPGGWVALGVVGAIIAWPTFAIVRAIESRPTGSGEDG